MPWSTAQIYNALLEVAKKQHSDDPVLRVIQPTEQFEAAMMGLTDHATAKTGELRAAITQILGALGREAPPRR